MDFFEFSYLECLDLLGCVNSFTSSNLGSVRPYYLQIFCFFLPILSFWESHYAYIGMFYGVLQASEGMLIFCSFFLMYLKLYNLHWFFFKFTNSLLPPQSCCCAFLVHFSCQLLNFSAPEFLFTYFLSSLSLYSYSLFDKTSFTWVILVPFS